MTIEEKYSALGGAVSWPALATGAAPWLTRLLLGDLPGPSARVKAWAAAGCPVGPWTIASLGDARLEKVCALVASRLPAPVAWYAATRALVVTINDDQGGWSATVPHMPERGEHALQVVAVHGRQLKDEGECACTVVHEIAHAWDRPEGPPAHTAAVIARALAFYRAHPDPDVRRAVFYKDREERRARALTHEWGFVGIAAEPFCWVRSDYEALADQGLS